MFIKHCANREGFICICSFVHKKLLGLIKDCLLCCDEWLLTDDRWRVTGDGWRVTCDGHPFIEFNAQSWTEKTGHMISTSFPNIQSSFAFQGLCLDVVVQVCSCLHIRYTQTVHIVVLLVPFHLWRKSVICTILVEMVWFQLGAIVEVMKRWNSCWVWTVAKNVTE